MTEKDLVLIVYLIAGFLVVVVIGYLVERDSKKR